MRRTMQAGVLVVVMLASLPALACRHGAHGHVGAGDLFLGLALAPLFGLGLTVHTQHHAPCVDAVVPQVVVAPQVVEVAPPVVLSPPPMPRVYVAPVVVAAAAPAAPVAVVTERRREEAPRGPARLGAKYLPGAVGFLNTTDGVRLEGVGTSSSIGLEYRVSRWFALRSDLELHPGGRSWDVLGAKVWLSPQGALRPYGSVSLSASDSNVEPGRVQLGAMGAAGLDLFLGRHFFLEAEARYRVAPSDCCREVPQLSGHIGGGLAFF